MTTWLRDWFHGRERSASERAERALRAHAWPPAVLATLPRLGRDGAPAYLVGGTVRDVLLGRRQNDEVDVATPLQPAEVQSRFERVEPIGLAHGTVLVLEQDLRFECTTFRQEGDYSDARRPDEVAFTEDPLLDLERRDLTVNAMAFDPLRGVLLDPHAGAMDLERRRLRAVGEPLDRFREDALRPLRVARFAATLEMEPDEPLRRALAETAGPASGVRLDAVSMERVLVELDRMMQAKQPSVGLEVLREAGLLSVWLPEIARARGVPQNRYHAYDVYYHSLYTCDAAPAEKLDVRWAALLHDVGKPDTRVERDGEGTFYDHPEVGARIAEAMLERLRFPVSRRETIVHLVREHMFDYRSVWTDAALRRWLRRVGPEHVADLFDLRIADVLGNGLRRGFPRSLEEMRGRIERLLETTRALQVSDLAVDGHDVMRELDLPPGPDVGTELERLLEDVLDHPERNQRDVLLETLHRRRAERGREP